MPHEHPPSLTPPTGEVLSSQVPEDKRRKIFAGTLASSIALGGAITATGWLVFLGALAVATLLHVVFGVTTSKIKPYKKPERITMAIVKKEPPPPPPPPKVEEPPPKKEEPKPKPKKKFKPPPPKVDTPPPPDDAPPPPSNEKPLEPTKEPPVVVTGVTLSSVVKTKSGGMKVRVGNTTYGDPNKEKFVAAKKVKAYSGGKPGWKPVRAATVTTRARVGRRWKPKYPRILVDEGIEGQVTLIVQVKANGKVRGVKIVKGLHPLLDKLAVKSVKKSVWIPAEKDGVKVDSQVRHSVKFEIYD